MKKIIILLKELINRLFKKKSKLPAPNIFSEPVSSCGDMIADQEELDIMEQNIAKNVRSLQKRSAPKEYVIPLAFHIVHKGEEIGSGTNISDEQIYSAVNALNEDYSKELGSRGDGAGVATPFRFMLANKDDKGNPTTGIYRINGAEKSSLYATSGVRSSKAGVSDSLLKSWSNQNNQHIYNIWIVSEIDNNGGGSGVQGYAYFPTTSIVDGIVQLYNATGINARRAPNNTPGYSYNLKSYTNLNKTLTHEMGHALGLFHTFQGNSCVETNCATQGDRVCDTPPTIRNSNGNYPACGGTQQVNNYMDYTNQVFKNMFTQGQSDRMTLAFEASRANLMNSTALEYLNTLDTEVSIQIIKPQIMQCPDVNSPITVRVDNLTETLVHKIEFEYRIGENIKRVSWYGPIGPTGAGAYDLITIDLVDLTETNEVEVKVIAVNDIPKENISDIVTVIIPDRLPFKVETNRDVLQGQIKWNLTEAISGTVLYSNPAPINFKPGVIETTNMCLADGDYIFTIEDILPGLQTPGAYNRLIDDEGNILVNATDGFSVITHEFTVGVPVDPVDPDPVDPDPVDPVDPVEPDFKALRFDHKYHEEKGVVEFVLNIKNDKLVDEYRLFRSDNERFENLRYVSTVKSRKNTNILTAYRMMDESPTTPMSYYLVKAIFVGEKEVDIFKAVVEIKTHWFIKERKIYSTRFEFEQIQIFTEDGHEIKNHELKSGTYIVVFGNEYKSKITISDSMVNHWYLKDGTIYSNIYKLNEIQVFGDDGNEIKNHELKPGVYGVRFGKDGGIERIEVYYTADINKHWYIKEGSIYSEKYRTEDIQIFTQEGEEVKNERLVTGTYIVVFKEEEKQIIEIRKNIKY